MQRAASEIRGGFEARAKIISLPKEIYRVLRGNNIASSEIMI